MTQGCNYKFSGFHIYIQANAGYPYIPTHRIITKKINFHHGDQVEKFPEIVRFLEISQPDFCLQVGDYWTPINWPIPIFWVPGNHERFVNEINSGVFVEPINSRMLKTGILQFEGIRILALAAIPNPSLEPGPVNYKEEDLEFCKAQKNIDIFLSHSPGFKFEAIGPKGFMNFEDKKITEILEIVKPKFAVSGHIHQYKKELVKGISLIRLGSLHNSSQFYDMIEL